MTLPKWVLEISCQGTLPWFPGSKGSQWAGLSPIPGGRSPLFETQLGVRMLVKDGPIKKVKNICREELEHLATLQL